jgi:hypothetical protein
MPEIATAVSNLQAEAGSLWRSALLEIAYDVEDDVRLSDSIVDLDVAIKPYLDHHQVRGGLARCKIEVRC